MLGFLLTIAGLVLCTGALNGVGRLTLTLPGIYKVNDITLLMHLWYANGMGNPEKILAHDSHVSYFVLATFFLDVRACGQRDREADFS